MGVGMTRHNPQMTLDAWDDRQARLGDSVDDTPTPRALDDDTTPAVAPRGALDLLRTLEAAA